MNGVDVTPLVEQELDRRFPGRSERRAQTPAGLRQAWTTVDRAWDAAIERAAALPDGSVDVRVDDEWSFAETLRHLVHATDIWLGTGVLGRREAAFHPLGLGHRSSVADTRPYDDVLAARADRAAMVRDFLATVTADVLDEERRNPHDPAHAETVRHVPARDPRGELGTPAVRAARPRRDPQGPVTSPRTWWAGRADGPAVSWSAGSGAGSSSAGRVRQRFGAGVVAQVVVAQRRAPDGDAGLGHHVATSRRGS